MATGEITIDQLALIDFRVGLVLDVVPVPESEKLYRLTVSFGTELGTRTIFAGLKKWYTPRSLKGRKFVFVANLVPRKMMGSESQGMMLAIDGADKPLLFPAPKNAIEGAKLR